MALSSYEIQVWNPTPYDRTEYITYGTPAMTKQSFWNAGLGYINIAEVTVSANYFGNITISSEASDPCLPGEQFTFHDKVIELFGEGLYPYIEYTDRYSVDHKGYFTLQPEDDDQGPVAFNNAAEVMHPKIIVQRWAARAGNLIAELTWTFYKDSRKSKMGLRVISESKKDYIDIVNNVKFGFDGIGKDHVDCWFHYRDKDNLIPGKYIADSQGVKVIGECWFLKDGYTSTEVETYNASKLWPLYGLYDWSTTGWGLFNVAPSSLSSTLSSTLWQQRKNGYNWFDPYEHKGRILNYRPGGTGAQDEFGAWTHLETVACYNVKNALFDQLTVAQETLRDGNYFEPGTFKFVKTASRPRFILWDGKLRVSNYQFGYDLLERTYRENGGSPTLPDNPSITVSRGDANHANWSYIKNTALKWNAHDAGHYGGIKSLCADFLLYGDFSSYYQLKQKVTQLKGYLPTLDTISIHRFTYMPGGWGEHQIEPREFGRPIFEAMYAYKVLGDENLLTLAARKVNEEIYWKWPGRFNTYWNGIGYYSQDLGHFGAGHPFWFTWQDGLLFQGLYALYEVLIAHDDVATNEIFSNCKTYLEDINEKAGKAFVLYGCRPANRTNPNYVAKGIRATDKWTYYKDFGIDTPYLPSGLSAAYQELSEPRKANQNAYYPLPTSSLPAGYVELPPFGPYGTSAYDTDDLDDEDQFLWSYNTAYGAWCMGLFSMVARYATDSDVIDRATELYNYWKGSILSGGEFFTSETMNYGGYPQPLPD